MKVKNIAFSGFMAAILMGATGANATISVASKDYVDTKSASVASTAIATELAEGGSIAAAVAGAKQAGLDAQSDVNELEGTVSALQSDTESALNARELTSNKLTGDTVADTDLTTEKYMSAFTIAKYVDSELAGALDTGGAVTTAVNTAIEKAVNDGKVGDAIDAAVENKQDKLTDANAGSNISITTDAEGKVTIASTYEYDDTELSGRVDALEGIQHFTQAEAEGLFDAKGAADTAKSEAISAAAADTAAQIAELNLDTTYEKVGVAAGLDATLKTELESQINAKASQTALDGVSAIANQNKTDISSVKTTADNALPAATYNQFLTDKSGVLNSGIDSTKVSGYDAVVSAVNNAESGLAKTNEIADAAATQASTNATAITNINEELVKKITMPDICDKTTCVLTYDTVNKVPAWVPLAEPETTPGENVNPA